MFLPPPCLDLRTPKNLKKFQESKRLKRENIPNSATVQKVDEVGIFWSTSRLGTTKLDRLRSLSHVLTNDRLEKIVIPVISGRSVISLRALDWLVINYSKRNRIAIRFSTTQLVPIYQDYRNWLRFWKRPLFDAFRRGVRVYFDFRGVTYSTTVAQLNFLFWYEKNRILDYAIQNVSTIERDMAERIILCRKEKLQQVLAGNKRKRCELSKASSPNECVVYHLPQTLKFSNLL